MANNVLASGKITRLAGTKEALLEGALNLIGNNLPVFGGILKAVSSGISGAMDWHEDILNKKTNNLFIEHSSPYEICERISIAITEHSIPTLSKFYTNKAIEEHAMQALAFLFVIITSDILKPGDDLVERLPLLFEKAHVYEKLEQAALDAHMNSLNSCSTCCRIV
jgi:hypothetical protein